MAVTNDLKIKLTVDVFDILHDKVYIALAKNSEQGVFVDHEEHGKLLYEVVDNLYTWLNKKK